MTAMFSVGHGVMTAKNSGLPNLADNGLDREVFAQFRATQGVKTADRGIFLPCPCRDWLCSVGRTEAVSSQTPRRLGKEIVVSMVLKAGVRPDASLKAGVRPDAALKVGVRPDATAALKAGVRPDAQ
jgi:hypothetical protein